MIVAFIYSQLILIPVLGLIFLGIRNENIKKNRMLKESLKALRIVGISRGRHL